MDTSLSTRSDSSVHPWGRHAVPPGICVQLWEGGMSSHNILRAKWPVPAYVCVSAVALCMENQKQLECKLQVFKNVRLCGIEEMASESPWAKSLSWSLFQTPVCLSHLAIQGESNDTGKGYKTR